MIIEIFLDKFISVQSKTKIFLFLRFRYKTVNASGNGKSAVDNDNERCPLSQAAPYENTYRVC